MIPQKFLLIWLTLNDTILVAQILIFGKRQSNGKSTEMCKAEIITYIGIIFVIITAILTHFLDFRGIVLDDEQIFNECSGEGQPINQIAGLILAYINMAMYCFARPFQVYTNWKNKSCEGVSLGLFLCAMIGDYCAGIAALLNELHTQLKNQIPYIFSGLVPAVFETIIIIQFFYYGRKNSRRITWDQMVKMEI